jgi:hypothetical protein
VSSSPPPKDPALEAALDALFAAPFPEFVAERKRLATELRAGGHKAAAAALAKVNRPTLASWAINQLVRRAPVEVQAMFASAIRVRLGDFAATAEHRQTLARLQTLVIEILRSHDQPTSDATLRRIATTLQALSAYGDFAPDLPGRLTADRDPPGFDAMALGDGAVVPVMTLPTTPSAAPAPSAALAPTGATAAATPAATPAAMMIAKLAAAATVTAKAASSSRAPAPTSADDAAPAPPEDRPPPLLRLVPPLPSISPGPAATKADDDAARVDEVDAEAAAAQAAAEAAVAQAAAALAAAQAAAAQAAARVQLARDRAVLEELRVRKRRLANAIFDHEQAIALMHKELEQRQAALRTARSDAEALEAELTRLSAKLEEP